MRKKLSAALIIVFVIVLFTACSNNEANAPKSSFGSESVVSFSDLVYTSDYVFTCYKPKAYEIVEKGNGILEINGNVFDDRVYFKRYTFDIVDLLKAEQDIDKLQVDEFFKDAFVQNESCVDALEDGVLYLALVYKAGDSYTMYFEDALVGLCDDGAFIVQDAANPWKSVSDIRYTYEHELAGFEKLDNETLYSIKSEINKRYDVDGKTNYKILSPQYLAEKEGIGQIFGAGEVADNAEVIVYNRTSKTNNVVEKRMSVSIGRFDMD